jgi:hypothetical protein
MHAGLLTGTAGVGRRCWAAFAQRLVAEVIDTRNSHFDRMVPRNCNNDRGDRQRILIGTLVRSTRTEEGVANG